MSERKFASTSIRDSEDKLGLTPDDVNKLLADTNTTVAKTKGFTKIGDANYEDGLIFTSLMKLLDAGDGGQETAGVSGLRDNGFLPSIWSGGSYEEAIAFGEFIKAFENKEPLPTARMANFVMLHNGYAKVGDTYFQPNGSLFLLDDTGKVSVLINKQKIPTLQDLYKGTPVNTESHGEDVDVITESYTSNASIEIEKDSTNLQIQLNFSVKRDSVHSGPPQEEDYNFLTYILTLYKDGIPFQELESITISYTYPNYNDSFIGKYVDKTLQNMPIGVYTLKVQKGTTHGNITGHAGLQEVLMATEYYVNYDNMIHIGSNGLVAKTGSTTFHVSPAGIIGRGNIRMGLVTFYGGATISGDGDVLDFVGFDDYEVERLSEGHYRIGHSANTLKYTIAITLLQEDRTYHIDEKTSYDFTVIFRNTISDSHNDTKFEFNLTKEQDYASM